MLKLVSQYVFVIFALAWGLIAGLQAQQIPRPEEGFPFLVTFGKEAPADWGDDDHVQIFFFTLPGSHDSPFYLRIFDPDTGGEHDEKQGAFDTRCRFSVYGGKGALTDADSQGQDPEGNYDSGNLLSTKVFSASDKYDNDWYTFGPINPLEGELVDYLGTGTRVFKVITEGISGNDGNLYKYYLSVGPDRNSPVEGSRSFTYEYTFRTPLGVCHIYPYVDEEVVSIQIHNFDFDNDGFIKLVSSARQSEKIATSPAGDWAFSTHKIIESERGNSLDLQIFSTGKTRNNNLVVYLKNQYDEFLPFYNSPIGNIVPKPQSPCFS